MNVEIVNPVGLGETKTNSSGDAVAIDVAKLLTSQVLWSPSAYAGVAGVNGIAPLTVPHNETSTACFSGDSRIELLNGKSVQARDVVQHMKLAGGGTVLCLVQSEVLGGVLDMVLVGGPRAQLGARDSRDCRVHERRVDPVPVQEGVRRRGGDLKLGHE